MKKTIALALVLMLAMLAFGCSQPTDNTATPTPGDATQTPDATTPTPDTTEPTEDTSLADVLAKGKLIQGMDDAFPPMGFRDENNELVGFDVDVAKEVAKRMGVELEMMPIDWEQKFNELDTGNVDALWNGFTIDEERKEKTELSMPYMKNRQVIVVLADAEFQTLADLEGAKLALQSESTAEKALASRPDFAEKLDGGKAIAFADNMKALMDLDVGGCDCVLMDEVVAQYYITQGSKYRILEEALADEEYAIGFKKGAKTLCAEVEKHLKDMAADGTLAEISNKWFGKDVTTIVADNATTTPDANKTPDAQTTPDTETTPDAEATPKA